MRVQKTLKCNCEEAFATVEMSLVGEIHRDTNKKVKASEFKKGYNYSKKMSTGKKSYLNTKVVFTEFDRPHVYAADFINTEGTNHIRYEFKEVDEYQCIVVYEETYDGNKKINRLNYKLVGWIMALTRKGRVKRTLGLIEKWALQERNKQTETSEELDTEE